MKVTKTKSTSVKVSEFMIFTVKVNYTLYIYMCIYILYTMSTFGTMVTIQRLFYYFCLIAIEIK